MRYGKWLAWLIVGWSLSGCTTFVTQQIEHPGHADSRSMDAFLAHAGFQREAMRTRSDVRIAYWIASPQAYHVKDEYRVRRTGKRSSFSFNFGFEGDPAKVAPLAPKGGIVLLHPWGMSGAAMVVWGIHFVAAGYQVVMPDLRSQGGSSDAPVGYGPREAGDIVELVHDLRARHRLPGPLYLLGASYGATVALFAAPQLPELRGVIAVEPYANAADVIRRAPASDLFGYRWLARWITPREVNAAIARASRKLGVDLEQVSPGDALAQTPACTLMLSGSQDVLISGQPLGTGESRRCAGANPGLHADAERQSGRTDFGPAAGCPESPLVAGELCGSPRRRASHPATTYRLVGSAAACVDAVAAGNDTSLPGIFTVAKAGRREQTASACGLISRCDRGARRPQDRARTLAAWTRRMTGQG